MRVAKIKDNLCREEKKKTLVLASHANNNAAKFSEHLLPKPVGMIVWGFFSHDVD